MSWGRPHRSAIEGKKRGRQEPPAQRQQNSSTKAPQRQLNSSRTAEQVSAVVNARSLDCLGSKNSAANIVRPSRES